MPGFGRKVKEESINDKMVRLFKEGKTVDEISKELDVKPDVITNVIRRRCGEDSIPETVIRSKNAMPQHAEEQPLKADIAVQEQAAPAAQETAPEPESEQPTEGMNKLERMMFEKEKKRQEAAAAAAEEEAAAPEEPEEVSMDGISTDNLDLGFEYDTPQEEPVAEPEPEPVSEPAAEEPEMEGISAADIPELSANDTIEEQPIAVHTESEPAAEEAVEEAAAAALEELAAVETAVPAVEAPAVEAPVVEAPAFDIPVGVAGSAFDKMKAFAQSQISANNAKIEELEKQLEGVEGSYTTQLEEAEKAVEECKVTYENVLTRGDEIAEKSAAIQAEHKTALARADEDYRRKLAELDEEYNNATARANKEFAAKEAEINAQVDAIDAEKETAKNNYLANQNTVNDLKRKIADEVDAVKAQIEGLKEENAGYEKFMA